MILLLRRQIRNWPESSIDSELGESRPHLCAIKKEYLRLLELPLFAFGVRRQPHAPNQIQESRVRAQRVKRWINIQ